MGAQFVFFVLYNGKQGDGFEWNEEEWSIDDDQYDTQYGIDNILKMDVSHKRLMYSSYIKLSPLKKNIGKWTTKFTTHLNLSREKSQMTICFKVQMAVRCRGGHM